MAYTIKNMLEELINSTNEEVKSNREIWTGIAAGDDFAQLGFTDKESLESWKKDNPYEALT